MNPDNETMQRTGDGEARIVDELDRRLKQLERVLDLRRRLRALNATVDEWLKSEPAHADRLHYELDGLRLTVELFVDELLVEMHATEGELNHYSDALLRARCAVGDRLGDFPFTKPANGGAA